jgi:hypothetical protein
LDLDFDVQDTPCLIPRFYVQHGQFVVDEIFIAKRIHDLDADNRLGQAKDRIQQMDQDVRIPRIAKHAFEGEIYFRIDS